MKLNKIFLRSYYYFEHGYSILSKPFQIITFITTIYYLAINNIEFLKKFFPSFRIFAITCLLFIIPIAIFSGYLWIKKMKFYIQGFEIIQEVNPYSRYKIPKVQIPSYKAIIKLCKMHNIDVSDMETILRNSLK